MNQTFNSPWDDYHKWLRRAYGARYGYGSWDRRARIEEKIPKGFKLYKDPFVAYWNDELSVGILERNKHFIGVACLVAKAKSEVDYNNPKWYRNIVFDEDALSKLAELFPERQIKTDYDAAKLIQELGDKALTELQSRLRSQKRTISGSGS